MHIVNAKEIFRSVVPIYFKKNIQIMKWKKHILHKMELKQFQH